MGIGTVLTVPFFFAPDCSQEKLIPGGRKNLRRNETVPHLSEHNAHLKHRTAALFYGNVRRVRARF